MYPIGKYKMALSVPSRSPRSTDVSQNHSQGVSDHPLPPKRARARSLDSSDLITSKRARKWSLNDKTLTSDINSQQDVEMGGPYKPDDEERDEYYFGLAGKPRLVARTSHNRWSRPEQTGAWARQLRKRFAAVSKFQQPEIVARWTKDLGLALITALDDCSWSHFFPIRIGLEDANPSKFPTVLLIAVERDSLQWEEGVAIALECRRILQQFKIANIEVEIREGKYAPLAASVEFESQINTAAWTNGDCETNKLALPMLSSLGYPIAYAGDQTGQGSLGLHLRLGDENPAVYGLTCRHVVSNRRPPDESYKVSEGHNQQNKQYHVQASDVGFEDCLKRLQERQEQLAALISPFQNKKKLWETRYQYVEGFEERCLSDTEASRLAVLEKRSKYNKDIIEAIGKISHKMDRQIGHLAFCPKMELSPDQPGYLKDWALIELDPNKFSKAPDNKVFVGDKAMWSGFDWDNGFLQLHRKDPNLQSNHSISVMKRGPKTGLTFGEVSSIEAVTRRPNANTHITWGLLIVPSRDSLKFSDKGDSGSSIFDETGAVVGLVNGSSDGRPLDTWRGIPNVKTYPGGAVRPEDAEDSLTIAAWPAGTDITFATPIQWVLEDIARFTGLEPTLA